ncbi:MAG: hypothetical protein MK170_02100 [Candidatus Thalassarchaeum sp.]|nr:hypothetical protein [Candidatus Thalassarchaeum sp.]
MGRVDSLIWLLLGFAQLLMGAAIGGDPILDMLSLLLQGTGGSSVLLGLYFLIFLARHQKEFANSYSKVERATLVRNEKTGILELKDHASLGSKAFWYAIPIGLTFISAVAWLGTRG